MLQYQLQVQFAKMQHKMQHELNAMLRQRHPDDGRPPGSGGPDDGRPTGGGGPDNGPRRRHRSLDDLDMGGGVNGPGMERGPTPPGIAAAASIPADFQAHQP